MEEKKYDINTNEKVNTINLYQQCILLHVALKAFAKESQFTFATQKGTISQQQEAYPSNAKKLTSYWQGDLYAATKLGTKFGSVYW